MKSDIKILAQTHIHTVYSAHAYSTVGEIVSYAKQNGLELVAITDHGPNMPDSGHEWHFANMRAIPHKIDDIYVLRGAEANIIDSNGTLDICDAFLKRLDLVIASIHTTSTIEPCEDIKKNTQTYLSVMDNPYVDIIGHSGWTDFRYDICQVLSCAKEKGVLIEINAHTVTTRPKNVELCREIAKNCARLGVGITVGADAHSAYEITEVSGATEMLYEIGFPEELIMNTSAEKLINHIAKRRGKTIDEYIK